MVRKRASADAVLWLWLIVAPTADLWFSPPQMLACDRPEKNLDGGASRNGCALGDYLIDGGGGVERKTYVDFALSLADGRLFPQAAALARNPHRPVLLLEGPRPANADFTGT